MPGPTVKQTENTVLTTPLTENSSNRAIREPIAVSIDSGPQNPKEPDGLFIRNGGIDEHD